MRKDDSYRRWFIFLALAFILCMLSTCLYAEVDESDMSTCENYVLRICEVKDGEHWSEKLQKLKGGAE